MNTYLTSNFFRPFASIIFSGALFASPLAQAEDQTPVGVPLDESEFGSSCIMVFGQVGKPFHFELESASDCRVGESVSGELSSLPLGLKLNEKGHALEGTPQRPGFHELVVLRTEQGVTREEVVLIDIQGLSLAAGGRDYASYFAVGTR